MPKKIWNDALAFEIYELVKSGLTASKVAGAIGVSLITFRKWQKRKPLLKIAVKKGRKIYKSNTKDGPNIRDYIFERLPLHLRKIWKEINKLDKVTSGTERINALLEKRGKRVRQHLFCYAWVHGNFSISQALRKVCISRSAFDKWRTDEPEFAEMLEEIEWHKKNFFEDALCTLVKGGDTSATIFVNKTYNRKRGYGDKTDVNINVSGEVKHTIIPIDSLQLSLAARKEILQSLDTASRMSQN